MRKFSRFFSLIVLILASLTISFYGCGTPASKIGAVISEKEITVYFDESDGDVEKEFTVALKGISKSMSKDLVFNFQNTNVANIDYVKTEEDVVTYKVTPNLGGESLVNVIHEDTNKNLGQILVKAIRPLKQISLIEQAKPYAIVGESVTLNVTKLIKLEPGTTTQTNIGFRLKNDIQGITLSQDGVLSVSQKTSQFIDVVAYSLDNDNVEELSFIVEILEKPSITNFTIFNAEDNEIKYLYNGKVNPIVLVNNIASKSSVNLRTRIEGYTNIDINYSCTKSTVAEVYKLNSNEIQVLSGLVGEANIQVRASIVGYEEVFTVINIPLQVVEVPTKVYANNLLEDGEIDVYTYYSNNKGQPLKLSVDLIASKGAEEIQLALNEKYRDMFSFYYEDGVTKVDIDHDILPNNTTIYVIANEAAVNNSTEKSAVLQVQAYRAQSVGVNTELNITLNAKIGATSIELDYLRQDDDKTVYVLNNNTVTMQYVLNDGAYTGALTIECIKPELAEFSYNVQNQTISIKGLKEGLTEFVIRCENGTTSSLIPLYVFENMENLWINTDSPLENEFVSERELDQNGSLSKVSILSKHGVSLQLFGDGTIYSKNFKSNNKFISVNSTTGYIYGYSPCVGTIEVTVIGIQPVVNNGEVVNNGNANFVEIVKEFTVEIYNTIESINISKENSNYAIKSDSIYSMDSYLDSEMYEKGAYFTTLQLNVSPSNAEYDVEWNISADKYFELKKVYVADPDGEYGYNAYIDDYEIKNINTTGSYSINKNKIIVIAKDYNDFSKSVSTSLYVMVSQHGKTYMSSCTIFAKSQTPAKLEVNTENVYIDATKGLGVGNSYQLEYMISEDATNKKVIFENFDEKIITITDNGLIIPNKAGATRIKIIPASSKIYNGTQTSEYKIVYVVVADGSREDLALRINNEKQFLNALSSSEYKHYLLTSNILLTKDIESSYSFNGSLKTLNNNTYVVSNINLKTNSLFGNIKENSIIENVSFEFNNVSITINSDDENTDFTAGVFAEKVAENCKINNITINTNNITISSDAQVNLTSINVGGFAGVITNASIRNVKFFVKADSKLFVSSNITATTSSVGGFVGHINNSIVENVEINCSIIAPSLNNVGGFVGNVENSSIDGCIVEMYGIQLQSDKLIENYIQGNSNVGGFAGVAINDEINTISNCYVKSYKSYLVVSGKENVGGFIGYINNYNIEKCYASVNINLADNYENVGGFIGCVENAINIENCFYKGNIQFNNELIENVKFISNGSATLKSIYAIINENEISLYNSVGENISVSIVDLVNYSTFVNNGFNITQGIDENGDNVDLNNFVWFISADYNNGNPILIIDGQIAEKDISIEGLDNALNNLDNLTAIDVEGLVKTNKLTDGTRYLILNKEYEYNLSSIFNIVGYRLNFEIVDGHNFVSLVGNILTPKNEGFVTLKLSLVQNPEAYSYVTILILKVPDKLEFDDYSVKVNLSLNIKPKDITSNYIYVGYENNLIKEENYGNTIATITGLTACNVEEKIYYISNGLENTVVASESTGESNVKAYLFVKFADEYVRLDFEDEVNINVTDSAKSLSTSQSIINLSLIDEFQVDIVVENCQDDDLIIEELETNFVKIVNDTQSQQELENEQNVFIFTSISKETSKSDTIFKYNLSINTRYQYPENLKELNEVFNYNPVVIKLGTKSNENISQLITINLSKQDILKITLEHFSSGQFETQNNVESFVPNEISSNNIIPNKFGLLTVNLYPDCADYDEIFITAKGENGEPIYLTQKVQYVNTVENKEVKYVTVKPSLEQIENGIYLKKISKSVIKDSSTSIEDNLQYDGNLYIATFIPKTVKENTKYTLSVTAYRFNDDGTIDESSKKVSKDFYLYAVSIPTISLNVPNGEEITIDNNDYLPVANGTDREVDIDVANYYGVIEFSYNLIGNSKNIPENILEKISVSVNNNKLRISVNESVSLGTKFEIILKIAQLKDGVLFEDTAVIKVIVVEDIIEDFYLSTVPDLEPMQNNLQTIATMKTKIYLNIKSKNPNSVLEKLYDSYKNLLQGYIEQKSYSIEFEKDNNNLILIDNENDLYYFTITVNTITTIPNGINLSIFYSYNEDGEIVFLPSNETAHRTLEHSYVVTGADYSTVENAIPVSTAQEFMDMMAGANYVLVEDIDLATYFGENTLHSPFNTQIASLNGNGKKIITRLPSKTLESGNENIGFFGTINAGTFLRNITIQYKINSTYELQLAGLSGANFGFFAGENNGIIFNCKVEFLDVSTEKIAENLQLNIVAEKSINNVNVGGFVGVNNSTASITNCYINNYLDFNDDTNIKLISGAKGNVAGFVAINSGSIAKSHCVNVSIENNYENSDNEFGIAGFVVENALEGSISECFADSKNENVNIQTKLLTEGAQIDDNLNKQTLSSLGNIAGFVYNNAGKVLNCYSNNQIKTPSRSAGFVFNNSGSVEMCHTTSFAVNIDENNNKANTPFTGTSELNTINNTGIIENCYYKSDNASELQTDVLFAEPAVEILTKDYSDKEFYGFTFLNNMNRTIWKWQDDSALLATPLIEFSNQVKNSDVENSQQYVSVYDQLMGKSATNPYVVYNANSLLSILTSGTHAVYNTENDEYIINAYIQFACNINMSEVENDVRFKQIQKSIFTGIIDGNNYTMDNLSVLNANVSVSSADCFGFFKKIGDGKHGACIKNLTINVKEFESTTAVAVGLLAGEINAEIADNSSQFEGNIDSSVVINNLNLNGSNVVISGGNMVGAVVGRVVGETYVSNVQSNLSVSAGYDSTNGITNGETTANLYEDAKVNVTYNNISYAGGLFGVVDINLAKEDVPTYMQMLRVYSDVNITGDFAGGVFAYFNATAYDIIFELSTNENSQHIGSRYCAGGIMAVNAGGTLSHARVEYSKENIKKYETNYEALKSDTLFFGQEEVEQNEKVYHPAYIGGIVGILQDNTNKSGNKLNGIVEYSYNKANVIHYNASYVGGIVGYLNNSITSTAENSSVIVKPFLNEVYTTGNVYAGYQFTVDDKNGEEIQVTYNYAGGAIGKLGEISETTINSLGEKVAKIDSIKNVVSFANFKTPRSVENYQTTNTYAFIGFIPNGVSEINLGKADEKVGNYSIVVKDVIENQSKLKGIQTGENRENIKASPYTVFSVGVRSDDGDGNRFLHGVWNYIDVDKSLYPTLAFTTPKTIIKISSETELKNALQSGATQGKTFIITNDIYLTEYWLPQKFKGTLTSQVKNEENGVKTYYTIYNVNINSNDVGQCGFFSLTDGAIIQNINFVFGSSIKLDENGNQISISNFNSFKGINNEIDAEGTPKNSSTGALIGSAINTNINNCNLTFYGSDIGDDDNKFIFKSTNESVSDTNNNDDFVGLLIGTAENTSISSLSLDFNEELNCVDIQVTSKRNLYAGGLIGKFVKTSENENANQTIIDCSLINSKNIVMTITNNGANTNNCVGGAVGSLENADSLQISNNVFNSEISIKYSQDSINKIGGLVGYSNYSKILNTKCNSTIKIDEKSGVAVAYIGGLVGFCQSSTIEKCASTVNLIIGVLSQNNYSYVGGFVGQGISNSISQNGATGNISISKDAKNYIGGFIGYTTYDKIEKCFTTTNLKGAKVYCIGGFVGRNSSEIQYCYSANRIEFNGVTMHAGGFAGYNEKSIVGCYSVSSLIGNGAEFNTAYCGGFVDYNDGTISNCYYLYNSSGISHNGIGVACDLINFRNNVLKNINAFTVIDNGTARFYPSLKSLESELFGDKIFEKGTILNPYTELKTITGEDSYIALQENSYYYIAKDCNLDTYYLYLNNNVTIIADNIEIKTTNSTLFKGDTANNYYIAGITTNVPFIDENNGKIFNCYSNTSQKVNAEDSSLYGFTNTNNGTILNSGVYVEFDMNETKATVAGFALQNKGLIQNSYVIGKVENYIVNKNSTNMSSSGGNIYGFTNNQSNGKLNYVYTALSTLSNTNTSPFGTVGTITNSYFDSEAFICNGIKYAKHAKTYSNLRTTFSNLGNVWKYNEHFDYNYGYPYLINYTGNIGTFYGNVLSQRMNDNAYKNLKGTFKYVKYESGLQWEQTSDYYKLDIISGGQFKEIANSKIEDLVFELSKKVLPQTVHICINANIKLPNSTNTLKGGNCNSIYLHGQNHLITNVSSSLLETDKSVQTEIFDLGIKGNISASGITGGFVSQAKSIYLSNCYSYVNITNAQNATGGLVGYATGTATIQNCFTVGDITCVSESAVAGGLVGQVDGKLTVTNCYSISSMFKQNVNATTHALIGKRNSTLSANGNYYYENYSLTSEDSAIATNDANLSEKMNSDVYVYNPQSNRSGYVYINDSYVPYNAEVHQGETTYNLITTSYDFYYASRDGNGNVLYVKNRLTEIPKRLYIFVPYYGGDKYIKDNVSGGYRIVNESDITAIDDFYSIISVDNTCFILDNGTYVPFDETEHYNLTNGYLIKAIKNIPDAYPCLKNLSSSINIGALEMFEAGSKMRPNKVTESSNFNTTKKYNYIQTDNKFIENDSILNGNFIFGDNVTISLKNSSLENVTISGLKVSTDIETITNCYFYNSSLHVKKTSESNYFYNCSSYKTIDNTTTGSTPCYAGGLVDYNNGNLIMENCVNRNNVSSKNYAIKETYPPYLINCANAYAGGLVGFNNGNLIVQYCKNEGEVIAICKEYDTKEGNSFAGGIVGYSIGGLTIDNCRNEGTIGNQAYSKVETRLNGMTMQDSSCEAYVYILNGDLTRFAGGIVGIVHISKNYYVNITNNTNSSIITGRHTGGIIGYISIINDTNIITTNAPINIDNCTNGGTIIGLKDAGGILGSTSTFDNYVVIKNSKNVGSIYNIIDTNKYEDNATVGGIVGEVINVKLENCFAGLYTTGTIKTTSGGKRFKNGVVIQGLIMGGLIGKCNCAVIKDCYIQSIEFVMDKANTTRNNKAPIFYLGGAIGYQQTGTTEQCSFYIKYVTPGELSVEEYSLISFISPDPNYSSNNYYPFDGKYDYYGGYAGCYAGAKNVLPDNLNVLDTGYLLKNSGDKIINLFKNN